MELCQLGYLAILIGLLSEARRRLLWGDESSHPFTLAYALAMGVFLQMMHGDAVAAQERAEAMIALTTEVDIPFWRAWALTPLGWALGEQGRIEDRNCACSRGTGTEPSDRVHAWVIQHPSPFWPYCSGKRGGWRKRKHPIEDALAVKEETGEAFYAAETYRIKGEVLSTYGQNSRDAEANFHEAIRIARQQGNRMFELRSAVSLCTGLV